MMKPEEQASYDNQAYAQSMMIDSMESIGQTYKRGGQYNERGSHEIVVIRTDHIGSARRFCVVALMRMIGWCDRPFGHSQHQAPAAGRPTVLDGLGH